MLRMAWLKLFQFQGWVQLCNGPQKQKDNQMKRPSKSLLLSLFLLFAAASARGDQTNLVQNIDIDLFGLKQGRTVTNGNVITANAAQAHIGTGNVINALGTATGFTFSRNARLVLINPLTPGLPSSVAVRDGSDSVDVTDFVYISQTGPTVESSVWNTRTGKYISTDYSLRRFILQDAWFSGVSMHFDVSGLAVRDESNFGGQRSDSLAGVSGVGNRNDDQLLLQGSVRIRGNNLEVVPDGPEPGV